MDPVIFSIGSIQIRWYSLCILMGIIVAYILAYREGIKKGLDKEFIFNIVFWIIIFGIIGARLYYVIFRFDLYKDNLLDVFKVWNGGLAIHGGIIAGLITLIVYCKIKGVKISVMTDIGAVSLIIAQAFGRWGNFFNQEAYGIPSVSYEFLKSLKIIPEFVIKNMYINDSTYGWGYYQPTFYYESLWCILGFVILLLIRYLWKNHKDGFISSIYLIWYGIGRYFIESLRGDSLMLFKLKTAQLVSILFIVCGMVWLIISLLKRKE